MLLNQCAEETTIEDSMEASSSVVVSSCLTKRKAEFDPEEEEEEESDGEIEEGKAKIEERKAGGIDYLKVPEWDVDSFDGLDYYSSPEVLFSSEDEPFSEEAIQHYRLFKRQMIGSKGFYGDPALRPFDHYRGIKPMGLEWEALTDKDFRAYWEEMVYVCLQKLNKDKDSNVELVEVVRGYYRAGPRSKSYITFMAREKPDGPLVEYQAKCMVTLDRKRHPILCRPAPTPRP
ncbi:Cystatin-related plant [Arabidopsis thaliana x Arabidopsis arenosa]|uniref:Cystatin-related plant n=1 Tax=Arabidopsis thaliana x Arabidopsis arenosa TaxID=1240361 RepID=A0A8T1Z2M6_9BRAS|nr:Cystatin-related plant [Arabidopsis thaliana x Arabidopsis arenosa]